MGCNQAVVRQGKVAVGSQEEGKTDLMDTAGVERIGEADIDLVVSILVVGGRAAGKLQLVAQTVLVSKSHNSHLVTLHKEPAEGRRESRSVEIQISNMLWNIS